MTIYEQNIETHYSYLGMYPKYQIQRSCVLHDAADIAI